MLTVEDIQRFTQKALAFSTFPDCSVSITSIEETYTRFANNGITMAGFSTRNTIAIESTRDGKTGTARIGETGGDAVRAVVQRSEELAALSPVNPEHLAPLGPQQYRETNDYDDATANARAAEIIPRVRAAVEIVERQKLVAAGLFERTHQVTGIANKAGLFGFHRSADAHMSTTVRLPDGSSSGWAGHPATRIAEIDGGRLAETAAKKCLAWKNPRRLDPGRYTVVLEPTAAGDIVQLIEGGFPARATEEGRTFLSRRGGGTLAGEKLFPDFIDLHTDPFDPRMPSLPWTFDRLPTRRISWIEKGIVKNLDYDRYWSEKSGKPATPGLRPLYLEGGGASMEDLIGSVDRGLLVTHFWYIRFVNPKTLQHTGLTRDGLFLIENGKISAPVMNFRFNDSPVRLLQNAKKLGKPVRVRGLEGGMMVAPAILADDFQFTSISDAV